MVGQPIAPCLLLVQRHQQLDEQKPVRGMFELEPGQPGAVLLGPRLADVMDPLAQQEAGDVLAAARQARHRRRAGAHQIAQRLVRRIRHPDLRQLLRAQQLGQLQRIAPVRLDPLARLAAAVIDGATTRHFTTALAEPVADASRSHRTGLVTDPELAAPSASSSTRRRPTGLVGDPPETALRPRVRAPPPPPRSWPCVYPGRRKALSSLHDRPPCLRLGTGPPGATLVLACRGTGHPVGHVD